MASPDPSPGHGLKPAHAWLRWLVLWVLVSLACAAPWATPAATPQSTSTPVPASSPTPQPTPLPQLPPVLVESDPLSGGYLSADQGITLYFSQPMEHSSVEGAFQTQPKIPGDFEWLDDSTLRFKPSGNLPPATDIELTVTSNALGANGLSLIRASRLIFHTPDYLSISQQIPSPETSEINPAGAVVVSFNQPVIPLTADTQSLPPAFSLEPAAQGKGDWVNTSTFVFYPDPPLRGGQRYTVRVNSQLRSNHGAGMNPQLAGNLSWTFKTASPRLISLMPKNGSQLLPDQSFELVFNQPMDSTSLEQNFQLLDLLNNPVKGSFKWSEDKSKVTFQPAVLLARGEVYRLSLSGRTTAQGGVTLGSDLFAGFQVVGPLAVLRADSTLDQPLKTYSDFGQFGITFNAPLKSFQDMGQLVSVDPVVEDLNTGYYETNFYINGFFLPDTVYTVKFSAGIRDRWDQAMGQPVTLQFRTAPARPFFGIYALQTGASVLYVLPGESQAVAQVVNLKKLSIASASIQPEQFFRLYGSKDMVQLFSNLDQAATWDLGLEIKPNQNEFISVPLASDRSSLTPGLYGFRVRSPELNVEGSYQPLPFLVVVSRVHLVMKLSANQVLVWAVNLENNQPVTNATISVYDNEGVLQGKATTDAGGVAQIPLVSSGNHSFFAVLGQPGDENFSMCQNGWSKGVDGWNFGYRTQFMPDQDMEYLYTDRPIYRPGQTVYFRAVVRRQSNGRYTPPDLGQISLKVYAEYQAESGQRPLLTTLSLPLSNFGTASGSFVLPSDASPGNYSIEGDGISTSLWFYVADYRKPELDLQVRFDQPEMYAGQDMHATLSAQYYFGAPAAKLPLRWTLYALPDYFYLPDYQTGIQVFGGAEGFGGSGYLGRYLTSGDGITGPDGVLSVDISASTLQDMIDSQQRQRLTLEVTVDTSQELPASGRSSLILHPADFYIGIRREAWNGQAGKELGFDIQTVDPQKNPSGNHPLLASFSKVTWHYGTSPFTRMQVEYTPVSSVNFQSDNLGRARLAFIPPDPGTYQVEVTGQNAVSQVMVWVGGEGSPVWPRLNNNRLQIIPDAQEYTSGQTAHLFIPNPFPGDVQVLLTVERSKVMRSQVLSLSGASFDLPLDLGEEDAPNVYVSVLILGKYENGEPGFRLGYQQLKVNSKKYQLDVQLVSQPQRSYPGGEVMFNLRVKDAQGQPVQGEFSLALVDKAVLALSDPNAPVITEAFYGIQPLGVFNNIPLIGYAEQIGRIPPGLGGGGGGEERPVIQVRQDFQDTAYWNGMVVTDANGLAEVRVKLPDNLTTWVLTVRGLTKDTQVGEATIEVVATKDLLVRPLTPRFLVEGDHVLVSAIVQNNTVQELSPQVALQSVGFTLDDPNQAVQRINLEPGDRLRVSWWGTVQSVDSVDLVFSAQAGALQDAARPEQGDLPVLRYSAPQTFGTSGVMAQADERLEVVSLPRSFKPTGGKLHLEMVPSLAAVIQSGLRAQENFSLDFTEPIVSRLWPDSEMILALQELGVDAPALKPSLESAVGLSLTRLVRSQNSDGGWSWAGGMPSNPYLTSYTLLALYRAQKAGFTVDETVLSKAGNYLISSLAPAGGNYQSWELDQFVFQYYVLREAGIAQVDADWLYDARDQLSPWARAMLAFLYAQQGPADSRVSILVSDLQSSADRVVGGVSWQDQRGAEYNFSSVNFTTAVVTYILERLYATTPDQPLINDAVFFLVTNRLPRGGWGSSYDTAWALVTLIERMKTTRDLQAAYQFSASLNGAPLAGGQVVGTDIFTPVISEMPLSALLADNENILRLARGPGEGRLYYRAFLNLYRPVEQIEPLDHGITILRRYYLAGQDCRLQTCQPVDSIQIGETRPTLLVRLTLTLTRSLSYVVVEDTIPAGTEIVNLALKTTKQGTGQVQASWNLLNPFGDGWGWWYFNSPQIYDDHIHWIAAHLPAGTYELVYHLTPLQAGEYRLIPAHAYQYYFPTVEGSSAGGIFKITP